jgi:coproporphyrinogen III oxidase-like Fe-S oxidoreductase
MNFLVGLLSFRYMSTCADFIIGLEHETEEDIVNTLEGALRLPIDFASFRTCLKIL